MHVVARGENLTRIAAHYGVTVDAIVQANGIANPSRIIGGQRLVIPGAYRGAGRSGRGPGGSGRARRSARRRPACTSSRAART